MRYKTPVLFSWSCGGEFHTKVSQNVVRVTSWVDMQTADPETVQRWNKSQGRFWEARLSRMLPRGHRKSCLPCEGRWGTHWGWDRTRWNLKLDWQAEKTPSGGGLSRGATQAFDFFLEIDWFISRHTLQASQIATTQPSWQNQRTTSLLILVPRLCVYKQTISSLVFFSPVEVQIGTLWIKSHQMCRLCRLRIGKAIYRLLHSASLSWFGKDCLSDFQKHFHWKCHF